MIRNKLQRYAFVVALLFAGIVLVALRRYGAGGVAILVALLASTGAYDA